MGMLIKLKKYISCYVMLCYDCKQYAVGTEKVRDSYEWACAPGKNRYDRLETGLTHPKESRKFAFLGITYVHRVTITFYLFVCVAVI